MRLYNPKFYNTLTRELEEFSPIDPQHVKIYVCGPTVYDRAHIGNARSVVVYDVLVRLLRHIYTDVIYVRNITDVDDKINAASAERGVPIDAITKEVTQWFHEDMAALGAEKPDVEPRATQHIQDMITMIEALIAKGHAYEAEGHVLFSVASDKAYGCLSRRSMDDMIAGARVEVAPYKRDAADFVLWKPSSGSEPGWQSPWGYGRPGWHIECSAMSVKYLGDTFDIHGGGADLMFPHHENEIAQSTCATGKDFAKFWVHNGFLTVNGEKMSKSLGNFITVHDLLQKGVKGEVIRYALLSTHYRKPLDWSDKLLDDAQKALDGFYRKIDGVEAAPLEAEFVDALTEDLNIPKALSMLHAAQPSALKAMGEFLGFFRESSAQWFKGENTDDVAVEAKIEQRIAAKKARDFATADRIRDELKAEGILLEDRPDGSTDWRRAG